MLAIHDKFDRRMRNRLKTIVMGWGLVRLLHDAGRTEEARATLRSLENGFPSVAEKSHKANRKPRKANRLRGITRTASRSTGSASTGINASEVRSQPVSIA